MTVWYVLMGILPWILLFGGTVYLIQLWKRPGPEQLHRAEVDELREQVSLMRDFIRDAMQRIARLEEERSGGRLGPGGRDALEGPDARRSGTSGPDGGAGPGPSSTSEGPPERRGAP